MSTLKVNTLEEATAGGATYFTSKAWVNFNGSGTVSIRSDGNVSSITDNGTGDFTTNIENSFSAASYAVLGTSRDTVGGSGGNFSLAGTSVGTLANLYQTGLCRCRAVVTADLLRDSDACSLALVI
jgi:hypothetical protein